MDYIKRRVCDTSTVIETQPDWLTVTSTVDVWDAALALVGRRFAEQEEASGNRPRETSRLGYLGVHCGRAFVGVGPQGTLAQFSGDMAARAFDEATATSDHVARLDVAATVRFDGEMESYERERWEEYLAWSATVGGEHVGRYEEDHRRGATCYVGSTKSDVLLRIYNKGREAERQGTREEAEHYMNCHRFELQLRNARACAMAASLSNSTHRASKIRGTLVDFLQGRGIDGSDLDASPIALVPGFRRRSDDATTLAWLENQVAPNLARLMAGKNGEAALAALGLAKTPGIVSTGGAIYGVGGIYRAPRL